MNRDEGRRVEAADAARPRRIVACLDVMDGRVVKGVRFRDHVDMGDVVELARRYQRDGTDELVFYDIAASPQERTVDTSWVERVAAVVDVPLCVAGGIDDVERAGRILEAGAAKVSVNSPALTRPELIDELAAAFGSERVVVGIDSECDLDGIWRVRRFTGDPAKTEALQRRTLDWVVEAQERGAGEIVLNCMGHDGVRAGYDIDQLKAAREVCRVPLVASGGAGAMEHFAAVFVQANVDGALAARVFHDGSVRIPELREYLTERGVPLA